MKAMIEAGWLVKRARALGGVTQAELAELTDVDQSAISRVESGIQDPGFESLQSLVTAAGSQLSVYLQRLPKPSPLDWHERTHAYQVQDLYLRELMPDGLCSPAGRLDGERETGPTVGEALYWLAEIERLIAAVYGPARWLHAAYYEHRVERDRDLVHAVLHCGAGAGQAAGALRAAIERVREPSPRPLARRRARDVPQIGDLSYAHAVLAIRGEADICARTARYCEGSVKAARAHERAQGDVREARRELELAQSLHAEHGHYQDAIETTAAAVAEAEREEKRAADERGRYGGGTHRSGRVGAAGERILVSALAELSQQAWTLYEQMAAHPSVHQWRPDPDQPPPLPAHTSVSSYERESSSVVSS